MECKGSERVSLIVMWMTVLYIISTLDFLCGEEGCLMGVSHVLRLIDSPFVDGTNALPQPLAMPRRLYCSFHTVNEISKNLLFSFVVGGLLACSENYSLEAVYV